MNAKLLSFITAGTAFLSVIAMTGSANASTLVETASYGSDFTPIDTSLNIEQFNSSLGHLDSVEIDFSGDLSGTGTLTNKTKKPIPVTLDLTGQIGLQLNGQSLFSLPLNSPNNYTVTDQPVNVVQNVPINANPLTYTDSSSLQSFIGNDQLAFLFSADANYQLSASNIKADLTTTADAYVTVIYNYTPQNTPEPSVTLGIGLVAGLGLLSQRKRSFSRA